MSVRARGRNAVGPVGWRGRRSLAVPYCERTRRSWTFGSVVDHRRAAFAGLAQAHRPRCASPPRRSNLRGPAAGRRLSPAGVRMRGVAVVAHGWTCSRSRHSDLGRALAEAGVTAVIPDLPNVMNLWGNGDAIVDLVHRLEGGVLDLPLSRAPAVLIGTSAGGLPRCSRRRTPGARRVDRARPRRPHRYRKGCRGASAAPAVVLLADASGCNLFGSGRDARACRFRAACASHCSTALHTATLNLHQQRLSRDVRRSVRRDAGADPPSTVDAVVELLSLAAATAMPRHAVAAP